MPSIRATTSAAIFVALSPFALGQSFTISVTPAAATVTAGASATATMNVSAAGGFVAAVTPSVIGLPAGATSSFLPTGTLASPYTGGIAITINTTAATPAGTYPINIVGSSGVLPPSFSPFTLTVQAAPPSAAAASSPDSTGATTLKNDFGFGVALGLSWNAYGPDIVNNATIDANGIVRVNTRANTAAGFMLESHYYVLPRPKKADPITGITPPDTRAYGFGPFVAAQPGSSQIISAVGAGLMFGWRRPKGVTPSGFGLGFGYEAIPAAQVLGSEFVNGQKAPVGPDGMPLPIRYETQDKGSVLFILSVSF
jgi:hypothetical protein